MNRLILIGNGFDLAHNLKTKYADFVNWYFEQRINAVLNEEDNEKELTLCSFNIPDNPKDIYCPNSDSNHPFLEMRINEERSKTETWKGILNFIENSSELIKIKYKSIFFKTICKNIESKGWVDIEYEYYKLLKQYSQNNDNDENVKNLNKELAFLREKLIEYLGTLKEKITPDIVDEKLCNKIYAPFKHNDIAIANKDKLKEHLNYWIGASDEEWKGKLYYYGKKFLYESTSIKLLRENNDDTWQKLLTKISDSPERDLCLLPDQIMFLNFNYTNTLSLYYDPRKDVFFEIHIHGELKNKESVIFGYGDELDEHYKEMQNMNNNEYLNNMKSIRYLESDNYSKFLSFIESAPFQVFIMGHSCGLSDRTLLNTIFEHKNCVSIKPFYHRKEEDTDNYLEIVQNISRNFNDMKLMRDRVVSKPHCETF